MRTTRSRARNKTRADFLTLLLALAAGACLFFEKADLTQAAAVFAHEPSAPQTVTLLLPARQWYLVRDGGRGAAGRGGDHPLIGAAGLRDIGRGPAGREEQGQEQQQGGKAFHGGVSFRGFASG